MWEDRTEGAQPDESPKEYVTVGEAAKLLGIHRNTVHNRIKVGRIRLLKEDVRFTVWSGILSELGAQVHMCIHWTHNAQRPVRSSLV